VRQSRTPDSLGAALHKRVRVDATICPRIGRGVDSPRPCCARRRRLQAEGYRLPDEESGPLDSDAVPRYGVQVEAVPTEWYAAHIVMFVEFNDASQRRFPVWGPRSFATSSPDRLNLLAVSPQLRRLKRAPEEVPRGRYRPSPPNIVPRSPIVRCR
jgi:hypothetical protein